MMQSIFYYTGLVFWTIIGIGALLSFIAYFGSALYAWYKDQETFTGGNNVILAIRKLFQPVLVGFYFLWFFFIMRKEEAKEIADIWTDEEVKGMTPIKRAMVLVCKHKSKGV